MIRSTKECPTAPSQRGFLVLIGVFVLVCSFAYGVVKGSRTPAQASADEAAKFMGVQAIARTQIPKQFVQLLPSDVALGSMGEDLSINGRDAEMLMFTSNAPLANFMREVGQRWEAHGFRVQQRSSDRRGVSVAMHDHSGIRASLVAWEVPSAVRPAVSSGARLQGTLSIMASGPERKKLPGVPMMHDAVQGALVASTDLDKRTLTSSYTNPGFVSESISFYEAMLPSAGWRGVEHESQRTENERQFVRGEQHLTLVFAQMPSHVGVSGFTAERTMMTAILQMPLENRLDTTVEEIGYE